MTITLELIIALIGAITGVTSLILHIIKETPNLKLETASFEWLNKHHEGPFPKQWIMVAINLRNLSKLSTTLENVYVYIGNRVLTPNFFMPSEIHIPGYSSQNLTYSFSFEDKDFQGLFDEKKEIILGVHIKHTFGNILNKRKTSLATGYFTLY
jgi:hypothetical protein